MDLDQIDKTAIEITMKDAAQHGLDIAGGDVRRTSSRFCFGVEHGDYNGTKFLFGVGTDRFIWLAYKPNNSKKIRIFSHEFPNDGVVEVDLSKETPPPKSAALANTWGRFLNGSVWVPRQDDFTLVNGYDGVLYSTIPGGGMSRSGSLGNNLIATNLLLNGVDVTRDDRNLLKLAQRAQRLENDYIGSPCGTLDPTMIAFAREGYGTFFDQQTGKIEHIPYGEGPEFRIVIMDTGTDRPGLENSTYAVRRAECELLVSLLSRRLSYRLQKGEKEGQRISCLADVTEHVDYNTILSLTMPDNLWGENVLELPGNRRVTTIHANLNSRLRYLFHAQQRFYQMMEAWKAGDIETVGSVFSADGVGLRDDYDISGRELETMVDIAHANRGVHGARMLGGGDKGASGALISPEGVDALQSALMLGYQRSHPQYQAKMHVVKTVDGIRLYERALR